jgi:RNA polymerase sigma factor (sigma-70 family)
MAGSAAPPPLGKLLMLAPASVVHTRRWAEALAARGIEVVLATQHPDPAWQLPAGLRVVNLPHAGTAGYFLNVPALRRLLRAEKPALLNAHYASGYGTTAALAGFRPWLLSIARRAAIDHRRVRVRARSLLDEDPAGDSPHPDPGPDDLMVIREELAAMVDATQQLSARDATALAMVGHLGFSPAEVADVLGISPGAAKVVVHRARTRLRALLGETPE